MDKKFKCPMMYGMQMPFQPEAIYMKPKMLMDEEIEIANYYEDEEDDKQLIKMYPESCKELVFHVKTEIDRLEERHEGIYDYRPDREMIDVMTDNAYNNSLKEVSGAVGKDETRQNPKGRPYRDLVRLLLLDEIFRRRRRYRRRYHYGYPPGRYDFDYDYYYYD